MKKLLTLPVLTLLVLLSVFTAGCHHTRRAEIQGSGKRVSEKRDIASFTSIQTNGAFNIEVTCQKDLGL